MKRILVLLAIVSMAAVAWAAPAERYLHVRVENADKQQSIRISLPVSVAAEMIPAIDHGRVHDGRIDVGHFDVNGIDVVQVLNALKNAPDGEFVTIQQRDQTVRVARQGGILMVHVAGSEPEERTIDIAVPWAVARALVSSGTPHQLNLEAAILALGAAGNGTQVTVSSNRRLVSIWVDSQSTMP